VPIVSVAPSNATTPNHRDKREQIVRAAKVVLLRDGPAACTSRVIARETGLNKGLIHYYFSTMEEIVDTAMSSLLGDIVGRVRGTAESFAELAPDERVSATVEEYLSVFAGTEGLALLWFDYWIQMTRAGRRADIEHIHDDLITLLEQLLADAGVPDPHPRARVLFSYVTGTLVRSEIHDGTFDELRPEIAVLSHMGQGG
jgi:AcrR family transcriptional regulator